METFHVRVPWAEERREQEPSFSIFNSIGEVWGMGRARTTPTIMCVLCPREMQTRIGESTWFSLRNRSYSETSACFCAQNQMDCNGNKRIKSLSSGSKAKRRRKIKLKGFEKDSTFPIEETDVNLASGHLEIQDLWVEMRSELFSQVYCQAQWQLAF